jgi:hypothetical protein
MAAHSTGPAVSGGPERKTASIYRVIAGAGILYVCLMTFSVQFESVKPGLDESWAWALNAVTQTSYIFGRDVVFTYGPLGFLMCPRPIAHNFQWASGFAAGIQAIYAALLVVIALTARTKRGFLLFLAGSTVASAFGMWGEYSYRILMGLCLVVASLNSPFAIPACILAGVLAPVFLLIKFSIGITCLSMMGVASLIMIFNQKAWSKIFALWFSAALALAYWVFHLFGNAGNFVRWLALSWEVASGYGAAMSFPGPVSEALVGIAVLAALLLSVVLLKGTARIPSLMFAIPGIIALKHGFVGNTGMSTGYFIFMVAAASVVFLFVETRAEWRVAGLLWAITCAAAIFKGEFMIAWPPITLERLQHNLSGQAGIQAFHNVWDSEQLAQELQTASAQNLAQEHLSAKWVAGLKPLPGGVDVFPWELTYLPANNLLWRPSLVLQQYSAYTHALDLAMAERLGSQSGPSALLLEFTGLSGRLLLTDTPLTFRRILADYEAVDTDYTRNLLWIRRRASPPAPELTGAAIPATRIGFDEWITPPPSPGKLFAQFFIKPTALGLIRQILWKTSPVYLRLEYENGDKAEFRILPATASGGVLINYLPRTVQDLADLMAGCAFNKVRRFQLSGPGAASFQQRFDVNWIPDKSPFTDFSHVQSRSLPEVVSVDTDSPDRQARMMTVTARDGDGYRRLKLVQIIANETNSYDGGCYLRYEVDRRILWLMDGRDRATGVAALGQPEVLEDARCTVNLAESWPEFRGDTVTLHLDVALKPKVSATQRVFARAIDEKGIESKLTEFAAWKPAAGQARENPWDFPPTPPSLSVESKKLAGSDKYILRVRASDLNGAEDIDVVEVIVNNVVDGRNTCYLRYDRRANTVSLINNAGTPSREPIEPGSSKELSNSYCAIAAPDAPSVKGSYDVYFSFQLALTEKMLAKRTIYLSAVDREGLRQSWRAYAILPNQ